MKTSSCSSQGATRPSEARLSALVLLTTCHATHKPTCTGTHCPHPLQTRIELGTFTQSLALCRPGTWLGLTLPSPRPGEWALSSLVPALPLSE